MKPATLAMIVLLGVAPVYPLDGQSAKPQTREGLTIAFGIGSGSAGGSCDFCDSDRQNDVSGFLRVGGAIRPNLIIAGQTRGWRHEIDATTTATIGFLLADVLYYPMMETGWYLEGGLGVGRYQNSDDQSNSEFTATGMALSLGTGYDIRVARNFSLTPFLSVSGTAKGDIKQDGMVVPAAGKFSTNLWQFGLALTWH